MLSRAWPWLVLALVAVLAVWHVVDFPEDIDGEFPSVSRPTFNHRPPAAYRLAEPGDTIDRIALYASAVILTVSALGWILSRRAALWPAAIAITAATGWFAVTPYPAFDGWHGLGWQAIANPSAPIGLRIFLGVAAAGLIGVVIVSFLTWRGRDFGSAWVEARGRGASGLLIAAAVFMALRAFEIPGVEPRGYWPRWSFDMGLMALGFAIVRLLPAPPRSRAIRLAIGLGGAVACYGLIVAGIAMVWFHRPLERLHAVVPGKIYISAMPTRRGLEIEQERLHFKTIINLFPEESLKDRLSAHLPDETEFAREHGIQYVLSSGKAIESDEFLDRTLALAQDPNAWPILVHCHGCMDRSPAWMGIYRFVVQKAPLIEIMRELEAHRGVRPKASVTLLYNRVLPPRAPEHYAGDPTAEVLREAAHGTVDPYDTILKARVARPNPKGEDGVPRR